MLDLDRTRASPRGASRRPSSVPLLGDYGFGSGGIARPSSAYNPYTLGLRRHDQRRQPLPLPPSPTPFTHPRQPQAWMHLKMDSDPLPEVDTSLFDPGLLNDFGSSSSSYIEYEAPSPYLINPFPMTNNLVAPLSQLSPRSILRRIWKYTRRAIRRGSCTPLH
ncbi:hypothetical protein BDQ17DRAFT_1547783 [Cyathus striatus]|nr:hypothetical protein BDQ17DRAFT_1547783 [Cyathus striatus]